MSHATLIPSFISPVTPPAGVAEAVFLPRLIVSAINSRPLAVYPVPVYTVYQAELSEKHRLMVQQNFAAQVDAFVMQTQRRMLAAFRTAAQFVIEDMIDRVPVDTGFLRASVVVTLDGARPPDRPLPAGSHPKQYELNPQYTLAIAGAEIGNTIWASFTANYGAHVEYGTNGRQGRGMVNWQLRTGRLM